VLLVLLVLVLVLLRLLLDGAIDLQRQRHAL